MRELIVDNFAGGGGASTGIEIAIGRSVDIAINHDPAAIAMHKANHPNTKHYAEDVWQVDPVEACAGNPVALAWFSPDCKHFSKSKGGKPVDKHIRGLAWVAVKWAELVKPRVIMLENVEEFQTWGPLKDDNRPDPDHKGETFHEFVSKLKALNYNVEYRLLRACDFGAPTTRQRFFLIARSDGKPIIWPDGEYADPDGIEVASGIKKPWKPVADVLDFSLPTPSIFETSEEIMAKYGIKAVRPLSEKTMARIFKGVKRFVIDNPHPYIVNEKAYSLIQYHGEQSSREIRGQNIESPIMTLDASNRYGLVSAFITQFNHNSVGNAADKPIGTMTAKANHFGEVRAFLVKYYNCGDNVEPVDRPLHTITSHDRMGLVAVKGKDYRIADIGLRMLTPRELFDAQGFPHNYIIDRDAEGNDYPRCEQVARCGNAVCPPIPAALVKANLPELCTA